jgi:hypothetical protein
MNKAFNKLTKAELWAIRNEIVLGSMFITDYANTFGYNPKDLSYFFEGYVDYLYELMEEDGAEDKDFEKYDNEDNLLSWFYCYDDLSWIGSDDDYYL